MAYADAIKRFPIVRMISLTTLDAQRDNLDEGPLSGMVGSALDSLKEIEALWNVDHDDTEIKDRLLKLRYQLASLKRYCCEKSEE